MKSRFSCNILTTSGSTTVIARKNPITMLRKIEATNCHISIPEPADLGAVGAA